ncbi:hypothetical protein WL21_04580 [Burkholderia ubonensis]|nr:hypothetical protein WJ81_15550 [Burkholderia ubonensis]KVZ57281.1 hypothetical protein WL20_23335 [Burkholderia ubonensis]KVZ72979.1 hypothetical protein WL21_04580 [Burkholderia ubonensis]
MSSRHVVALYAAFLLPSAAFAAGAVQGDPPVDAQVGAAARDWLRDYAARQHVDAVRIDAVVLPQSARNAGARPACGTPDIAPVDTKRIERLRFAARCPQASRPTIYIVRGEIIARVLVAAAPIPAGRPLTPQDVELSERNWAKTPDALADPAALNGRVSRRALKSGQVLQKRFLKGGEAVRKGQAVRIVARTAQVEVSVAGTALEDGAMGDTIRVRRAGNGHAVTARVAGPGLVEPLSAAAK